MKKLFYLSVALCAITCVAAVFNGCSDITENELGTTHMTEVEALKPPQNKIPKSLWVSLAKAQDDADKYFSKMDQMTIEEINSSKNQTEKYAIRFANALKKINQAYDEAYEDSCADDDFPIDDTTYYKSPVQMTLAIVKKNHSEAFYKIIKNLLAKGTIDVNIYEIAESDELSDDEKLRLVYIYPVSNTSNITEDSISYGDRSECYKTYLKNLKWCDINYYIEYTVSCLKSKKKRDEMREKAEKEREECKKRAKEAYEKCLGGK